MIQKVTVIGDGGAFDYDKTNSSFMIHTDKGNILYDCGGNVFDKLREMDENGNEELLKHIIAIIISHDDDDHVGSVRTLLYYLYFVEKKYNTPLYCPEHMVSRFLEINKELKSSQFEEARIVSPKRMSMLPGRLESAYGASFAIVPGIHHTKAYGIVASDKEMNVVAISGDTKANCRFEDKIRDVMRGFGKTTIDDCLIFQDYSFWDAPSRQVHACDSDVEVEYSSVFLTQAIMYHNNKANLAGRTFRMPIKFEDIVNEQRLSTRKKI
jgi:ribonuclease BN (tRNA processing enzyme)